MHKRMLSSHVDLVNSKVILVKCFVPAKILFWLVNTEYVVSLGSIREMGVSEKALSSREAWWTMS